MSSSPRTAVGAGINVRDWCSSEGGIPNGSEGAALPSHVGMFSRARSDCRLSLLNYLRTWLGMPLTDRLE